MKMRDIIDIVGSAGLPEGFSDDGGMLRFQCPTGSGLVSGDFSKRQCFIYEFSADGVRQGNGRRTLIWLRQFFKRIAVVDPGDEGDDSRLFWEKMRDEKLVTALYDEDMRLLGRSRPRIIEGADPDDELEEERQWLTEEFSLKDGRMAVIQAFDDNDNEGSVTVYVTVDSVTVAEGKYDPDRGYFRDIKVDEAFRRQGIATTIYDYIENQGFVVKPSNNVQADGVKFWNTRR